MGNKLKVDEKQGLKACIDRYRKSVLQATAGSIAAMTPPGRRKGKTYNPTARTGAQCKAGIRKLKEKNIKKFLPLVGYAAGEDRIYTKFGRSPVHTYVRERGRKARPTNLPIFSSAEQWLAWYREHTRLNTKCTYRRFIHEEYAFVSSSSVLKQAAKRVNETVGEFIAGWFNLFEYVDKPILPYTTHTALAIAEKDEGAVLSDPVTGKVVVFNSAQNEPSLDRYTTYIILRDLPATVAYYERVWKVGLEKDIQKTLKVDKAGAKTLACTIRLFNPFNLKQ